MSVTAELYDFGVAVDVTAPAGAIDAALAAQYRATESDLRNALTAEKTIYTDNQTYSADTATLKTVEPSLDWGGKLPVVVATRGVGPTRTWSAFPRRRSRVPCSRSRTSVTARS